MSYMSCFPVRWYAILIQERQSKAWQTLPSTFPVAVSSCSAFVICMNPHSHPVFSLPLIWDFCHPLYYSVGQSKMTIFLKKLNMIVYVRKAQKRGFKKITLKNIVQTQI